MKDPLVKGHPIHAMLTDLPVGAAASGAAFDMIGAVARSERWQFAATASYGAAFVSGCLAAVVGYWDYQAVPQDHPARSAGAIHGYINVGALAGLGIGVALRARSAKGYQAMSGGQRFLPLIAFAMLAPSGWLGGEMVFRQGWRVTPAQHAEELETSLRKDGEQERIDAAHQAVAAYERDHALIP